MAPISKDPTRDKSRSPLDVSSDSVHCNALTQSSTVSYAFSCHTIDTCGEEQDVESASALPPPHSHPWVHVFSKSSSTTSLRTQCAAAAVTHRNVLLPKVLHQRSRRAQKKKWKITNILREVIVPSNHFKLSTKDIDSEIFVFDGGNLSAPPIKPPDGILWRSISVNVLHVEDETNEIFEIISAEAYRLSRDGIIQHHYALNHASSLPRSSITNHESVLRDRRPRFS